VLLLAGRIQKLFNRHLVCVAPCIVTMPRPPWQIVSRGLPDTRSKLAGHLSDWAEIGADVIFLNGFRVRVSRRDSSGQQVRGRSRGRGKLDRRRLNRER
jgi:hypothetical protein